MLTSALEHKEAIKRLTSDRKNGLREFELDDNEWDIVTELRDTLKVRLASDYVIVRVITDCAFNVRLNMSFPLYFSHAYPSAYQILKHATTFFSRDTPNLATVIPAMDHIDRTFSAAESNSMYNNAIRASISVAKRTLNRYYSMTDMSDTYRITMGMLQA